LLVDGPHEQRDKAEGQQRRHDGADRVTVCAHVVLLSVNGGGPRRRSGRPSTAQSSSAGRGV
jgi:hypothetical protein